MHCRNFRVFSLCGLLITVCSLVQHPGLTISPWYRLVLGFAVIFSECNLLCFLCFNLLIQFHFVIFYFICLFIIFFTISSNVQLAIRVAVLFLRERLQQCVISGSRPLCFPRPLRNSHPIGSAKGCRGAARDILVVALAEHNNNVYRLFPLIPSILSKFYCYVLHFIILKI